MMGANSAKSIGNKSQFFSPDFLINQQDSRHITVDFVCQKSLALTTLKEFLEIFVSSIKNSDSFHSELMGDKCVFIGLNLDFN